MIYILSGPIRTGKTSSLIKWAEGRDDVVGLVCPDDSHGRRYFLKIGTQDTIRLEVTEPTNEATLSVGPFTFYKSAFNEAITFLKETSKLRTHHYLILDELGKLELKNTGLHEAASYLIPHYVHSPTQHLILVVRNTLLQDIGRHYHIDSYRLVSKESLDALLI